MTNSRVHNTRWADFPIHKKILKSLKEQKLHKPLPIQVKTLKATLIRDKHVLGAARTGSGKTLAYAIPVLNRILTSKSNSTQLKKRICEHLRNDEDFELVDGEKVSIEDMIVDRYSNDGREQSDDYNDTENLDDTNEDACNEFRICPEAIVLVPTRELAVQVKEEFDKLINHTDIKCSCIIGGINQDKQVKILNKFRPQIIIATPGRLYDLIQSDTVDYINTQSIASIQSLVIDEADRMVQKGHFDEMLRIIDIIKESNRFRQGEFPYRVYLYSATLTFLHELPERLKNGALDRGNHQITKKSKKIKDKPQANPKSHTKKSKIKCLLTLFGIEKVDTKIIDLNDETTHGRPPSEQLSEFRINCLPQEKDLYLYYFLLENPNSRSLIFCNSKDCLRRLSNVLKYLGFETLKLHSEMDQKKRLSNLERFRTKPNSILIATDVAARGLDIKQLDCVIHYQVPKTCESYIHRSGRTARVFQKGVSLTLCEPKEVPFYRRLCSNINGGEDLEIFDVDIDLKNLMKGRVQLAQQCDKLDHRLRETKSNQNWFLKAAKDCEIELDEEDMRQLSGKGKSRQQNLEDQAKDRRRLNQLHKQLQSLLKKPLVTRGALLRSSASKINRVES